LGASIELSVQAVTALGGPAPQVIANWYEEHGAINHDAMDAAIAPIAGYFTDAPPGPELPRVSAFQRAQLKVTLIWAADRFRLPEPTWVNAIQM
jgi:hypothetical protein